MNSIFKTKKIHFSVKVSLILTVVLGTTHLANASLRCETSFLKQTLFEAHRESVAVQSNMAPRALDEAIASNKYKFNNWDTPTMLRLYEIASLYKKDGITLNHLAVINRVLLNVQPLDRITPDLLNQVAIAQIRLNIPTDRLLNFLIVAESKLADLKTESSLAKSIMILQFLRQQGLSFKNAQEIVDSVLKFPDQSIEDSLTEIAYSKLTQIR